MAPDLKEICLLAACLLPATPALADEMAIGAAVSLELNAATSDEDSCTLTFMVINGHPTQIDQAVYETVLFDSGGQVDRLTLFDFGTLPPGRPRVWQFSIPGTSCEQLGQVLFNGAHACTAPALSQDACESGLQLSTRAEIEVMG